MIEGMALYDAIYADNPNLAQVLIETQFYSKSPTNGLSLALACKKGYTRIVDMLIRRNVDVNLEGVATQPLHDACRYEHIEIVKLLLAANAKINAQDLKNEARTPLHIACAGDIEIAKVLIAANADMTISTTYDGTPLHTAYKRKNLDIMELLIQNHVNIDIQNNYGNTVLAEASANDDINTVAWLIQNGANVNAQSCRSIVGETALHRACIRNNIAIIKLLLDNGAKNFANEKGETPFMYVRSAEIAQLFVDKQPINIHAQDHNGHNALYFALRLTQGVDFAKWLIKHGVSCDQNSLSRVFVDSVCDKHVKIVEFMLEQELILDIDKKTLPFNKTALFFACEDKNTEIAKILVAYGANDVETSSRQTSFLTAVKNSMIEVVKLMLDKNLVANIQDRHGHMDSALCLACYTKNVEMIKLLMGYEIANSDNMASALCIASRSGLMEIVELMIDKVSVDDRSNALYHASLCRKTGIAKLLIQHGADVNKCHDHKNSSLHAACCTNNVSLVELLILNGAKIDTQNNDGNTPLYNACVRGRIDVVKCLIKYGVDINSIDCKVAPEDATMSYKFIDTLCKYQDGKLDADNTEEYGLAMINKLVRGAAVEENLLKIADDYTDFTKATKQMYQYAVDVAHINIYYNTKKKILDMIHNVTEKYAFRYIDNPFISLEIKQQLLFNAVVWYTKSEDGSYVLHPMFDDVQKRHDVLSKHLKAIKAGQDVFDAQYKELIKGYEYSTHAYRMIELRHITNTPCTKANMLEFIEYIQTFSITHPKGLEIAQYLCRYDNLNYDIFTAIKESFDKIKDFKCQRHYEQYDMLKSMIMDEDMQKKVISWHHLCTDADFDATTAFAAFITEIHGRGPISALFDHQYIDPTAAHVIMTGLLNVMNETA